MKIVRWISIVVIHIIIILKPKDAKLIMIVQLICSTVVHIGVKRMKKLHVDGLLESLDYESFVTSEPCLLGKMTKLYSPEQWSEPMTYWK